MSPVIHVATVGDESFRYGTAVLIQSICDSLDPRARVQFHIVDISLTPKTREALLATVKKNPNALGLSFLNPNDSPCFRALVTRLEQSKPRVPFHEKCWLAKIVIPDVLAGVSRCLYLDSDIFCGRDLFELESLDWGANALLAVRVALAGLDPAAPYFNGGFMYFDLDLWRKENLSARSQEIFARAPEKMIDQSIFNLLYYQRWLVLDGDWNHQCPFGYGIFADLTKGRKFLLHYVTSPKPWEFPVDARTAEFFAALDKTAYAGWRPNSLYWAVHYRLRVLKMHADTLLRKWGL
jgi:lipopolysaccharide biosynthesis glycosyltransferase